MLMPGRGWLDEKEDKKNIIFCPISYFCFISIKLIALD